MAAAEYFNVVQQLYTAYFGRPADTQGLASFAAQLDRIGSNAPKSITDLQAAYKTNATVKALVDQFGTSAESNALYTGSELDFVNAIYRNVFNRDADLAGLNFWSNAIKDGTLSKANAAASIMAGAQANTTPAGLIDAKIVANKLAVATNFTAAIDTTPEVLAYQGNAAAATARAMLSQVNDTTVPTAFQSTVNSTLQSMTSGTVPNGSTLPLTTGADNLTGTSSNDTFNANVVGDGNGVATVETLTSLDNLDGGAGVDTLNYTTVGAAALPGATIKNIEVINVVSDGAATADVSGANVTGVTTLNAKAVAAAVDLDVKSNVTSVSVTGTATTVAVDDAGTAATTADKLASVSVDGATGLTSIGSDALTSLSLTKANGGATVTAAAATRALSVSLNEVTAGTVTDAEATTLNVSAAGVKSAGVTLTAVKATSVTIAADETLGLTGINVDAAKTIAVTGDSLVTIGTANTLTALESVTSVGSTGGVSIGSALGTAVAFTGGAGKDAVTLGATTKAIAMGAGDDTVTMSVAVGAGGSVNGGDGSDTLSMAAADAATVSATDVFAKGFSGFEVLQLGVTGAAGTTVNLANLNNINNVKTAGNTATHTLAITNMTSGATLEQTGVFAAAASVALKDSSGAADVLNIRLNGAANLVNTAALTVGAVETINITATDSSVDTTTLTNPAAASTIFLAAADATTINVAGNHGVDFTGSTLTKVTSLDASGVVATGATSTATAAQIATAGAVTFSSVVTDKAVTIKGGNGADVFSAASIDGGTTASADFIATNVVVATIDGGAGNDTITGSAGKDAISGGAGNDSITGGVGADTLTGGAGNDTFKYASAAESTLAKMDTITDFAANKFGNGLNGAAGTGAGADATKWTGDVISFDVDTGVFTKVAVSVQSNASDAQVFLQNTGAATADTVGAALDSSSGKLYIDWTSDGTVDSVITLTGVTTIDAAAFLLV